MHVIPLAEKPELMREGGDAHARNEPGLPGIPPYSFSITCLTTVYSSIEYIDWSLP